MIRNSYDLVTQVRSNSCPALKLILNLLPPFSVLHILIILIVYVYFSYCSITWSPSTGSTYPCAMSNRKGVTKSKSDANCKVDYVIIPNGVCYTSGGDTHSADLFCGSLLNAYTKQTSSASVTCEYYTSICGREQLPMLCR